MARFTALEPHAAHPKAKSLLDAVQSALGVTPNMMRTMAERPAVLDGYLALDGALAKGHFGRRIGEQLALTVAEENGCGYCAAAHTVLGRRAGLTDAELDAAREGTSADPRAAAAMAFARTVAGTRGHVQDADVEAARAAGLDDGDLGEVVAHVALNVFTNYFNSVAGTDLDFPSVRPPRIPVTVSA
ncbi:MAG TPA: carboxymuconolactone decarboxylase family protein [Gemmatimonadaceae bacterium]|nr:carboxymuconolactone decarboxylase family protein [Gemmatimonadaceae bacterium]